jgi:hypothetical protein
MLRMLVFDRRLLGYYCGNLGSLAASVRIWARFPWVIQLSGPDCLITLRGAQLLGGLIDREARAHETALLADRFWAPKGHLRLSMDVFVFWPERMLLKSTPGHASGSFTFDASAGLTGHNPALFGSIWLRATGWCLHGFSPSEEIPDFVWNGPKNGALIPEALLQHAVVRFNLSTRLIQDAPTVPTMLGRNLWWKEKAQHPPESGYVWHSHNMSAVSRWLTRTTSGVPESKPH